MSSPRTAGLVGVAAAVSSMAFSWNPSYWGDEAATVLSAQRSLPSLFEMLPRVDAVHGLYYVFMHFWIRLVGISEFAVRFPSAIAVGIAAAGTVVLAQQLASRRVAVIAGIACIVLPRFTYMGIEARSYAMATAVAVWLTMLLVVLVRSRSRNWLYWGGYALLAAFGSWLFLYLVLLLVAHGAWVLLDRQSRDLRSRWAAAAGVAVLASLPIALFAVAERNQVAFLSQQPLDFGKLTMLPWFGNPVVAIVAWALIVLAAVTAVRRRGLDQSRLTLLSVLWLLIPGAILVGMTLALIPIYSVRYLSFSTPAAALLIGLGADALRRRYLRWIAVGLLVASAALTWVSQRGEYGKDGGSDWRQVSEFMGTHATAGDGVYFDDTTKPSQRPRLAMHLYPAGFTGLVDFALDTPFDKGTWLWDSVYPLDHDYAALDSLHTIWVIDMTGGDAEKSGDQARILKDDGFRLATTTNLHRTTVYEYTR
ncbi:glycosyltransferase family 39 protein [soil metagenome]